MKKVKYSVQLTCFEITQSDKLIILSGNVCIDATLCVVWPQMFLRIKIVQPEFMQNCKRFCGIEKVEKMWKWKKLTTQAKRE